MPSIPSYPGPGNSEFDKKNESERIERGKPPPVDNNCTCLGDPDNGAYCDPNCPTHGTARALTAEYGDPPSPPLTGGLTGERVIGERVIGEVTEDEYRRYLSGALNRCPPGCMCSRDHEALKAPAGIVDPTKDSSTDTRSRAFDLLADAAETIGASGPRATDYGSAIQNFTDIGRLWAVVLGLTEVTAEQVAMCCALIKVGRLLHSPSHRDSWLDSIGYLALGGDIAGTPGRHQ